MVYSHVTEISGTKIKALNDQRINWSLVRIFVYIQVRPKCDDYTRIYKRYVIQMRRFILAVAGG
jgi:hypothetical protein